MKYFRNYPWGMQLTLFLLMTFTFGSFISVIILSSFEGVTGMPFSVLSGITAASPKAVINAMLGVQGLQNVFMFAVPALVFAYLAHPRPAQVLGLRRPGKNIHFLLGMLLMLGAAPALMLIQSLVSAINFGPDVKAAQKASETMMEAMISTDSMGGLIVRFGVMAIIPGIGEELFFRGMLMRFARQRSRNIAVPILFSAVVFSLAHANVYGYLPIFLAGVLLALIYMLTGSLLCSMAAHVFHNGLQLYFYYLGTHNAAVKQAMELNTVPLSIVAAGLAVFALALWLLLKNRTPLPPNWADNFTPAELARVVDERRRGLF